MASYLLLVVIGIGIIAIGLGMNVFTDIIDEVIPLYNYEGTQLAGVTDSDANTVFYLIISVFKNFLILAGVVLLWFVFNKMQKPVQPW